MCFSRRILLVSSAALLVAAALAAATAAAAQSTVVEDCSRAPVGSRGIPPGWQGQTWGSPKYDFTVVTESATRVLHLVSVDDSSTISKSVKVDARRLPVLQWRWKGVTLPTGGDARRAATDDETAPNSQNTTSRAGSYVGEILFRGPRGAPDRAARPGRRTT